MIPLLVLPTPPKGAFVTRQSDINQISMCGWRVGYKETPGYLQAISEPLGFGQLTHWLCEQHVLAPDSVKERIAGFDEMAEKIMVEQYDWSISKIPNYAAFKTKVIAAYRLWLWQVYPEIEALLKKEAWYVEVELYMPLNDKGSIWLKGTSDLGVINVGLHDWKTAGSPKTWTQQKADYSLQVSLYYALAKYNFGEYPNYFKHHIYIRSSEKWIELITERTPEQVQSALKTAYDFGNSQKSKIFLATPVVTVFGKPERGWYCSKKYCDAWNVCEYKELNDSTDTSAVKERTW